MLNSSVRSAVLFVLLVAAALSLPACNSKEKTAAIERERSVEYGLQSYFSEAVIIAQARRMRSGELPLDTEMLEERYPGLFANRSYVDLTYSQCELRLQAMDVELPSLVISIVQRFRTQQPERWEREAGLRLLNAYVAGPM